MPDEIIFRCSECYQPIDENTGFLGYRCEKCRHDFAFNSKYSPEGIVTCPYCGFKQYYGEMKWKVPDRKETCPSCGKLGLGFICCEDEHGYKAWFLRCECGFGTQEDFYEAWKLDPEQYDDEIRKHKFEEQVNLFGKYRNAG